MLLLNQKRTESQMAIGTDADYIMIEHTSMTLRIPM